MRQNMAFSTKNTKKNFGEGAHADPSPSGRGYPPPGGRYPSPKPHPSRRLHLDPSTHSKILGTPLLTHSLYIPQPRPVERGREREERVRGNGWLIANRIITRLKFKTEAWQAGTGLHFARLPWVLFWFVCLFFFVCMTLLSIRKIEVFLIEE